MSSSIDTSVLIGFLVTFFSLLSFSFLQKYWSAFYSPKEREKRTQKYNVFVNWIAETWNGRDEEFLTEKGGADVVLYLKFLRYSFLFFLILSILGCSILIPINYQGMNRTLPEEDALRTKDLDVISLANISQGSDWMYAHVVSTYLFTLCMWGLMYKLYQSYVDVTNQTRKADSITNRTIMVHGIPNAIHSSQDLLRLFIAFYGNHVTAAYLVPKLSKKLDKLVNRREELVKKYQIACEYYKENKFEKRLQHKVLKKKIKHHRCSKFLSYIIGRKVDSIEQYSKDIKELDGRILSLQEAHHKNTRVGFVTFSTVSFAMQCAQTIHSRRPKVLEVRMAPDPDGLLWKDLHWGYRVRFGRELTIGVALICLFLFWSIPVTFISAFSNLESLAKQQGLKKIVEILEKSSFIKNFLDGFLPSLALNIFMALLPSIITWIIKLRAWYLRRELEVRVLITYWSFLLLNVWLVSTIAGSIFKVLENAINSPVSFVNLLSNSLPSQAIFFTNYIITDSLTTFTLNELVRLTDFLKTLGKRCLAKTKKAKQDVFETSSFDYHLAYAEQLLIFGIAFSYSSMAPIILPFAAIYFVIAYSVAKYNFLFVMKAEYEGVKLTRAVIDILFVITLIYQITTAGALGAKKFAPATSVFFLIPATFILRWRLAKRFFMYSKYLPLEECPFPDAAISHELKSSPYPYAHPLLDTLEPPDGSEEYKERVKREHHRQIAALNESQGISDEIDVQFSETSSSDRTKLMKEEQGSRRRLTFSLPENLQAIPGLNRVTNTVTSGIQKATNVLDELLIV